jgi:predicted N-acyltransferase
MVSYQNCTAAGSIDRRTKGTLKCDSPLMNPSTHLGHRPATGSPGDRGPYSISLVRSIDERDADEWHTACGGRADAVMDPRFLRAVEHSMGADTHFWNVIFRDAAGMLVGAAALSLYTIDGLLLAPPRWKQAGTRLRRLWPNFLKVPVLLCGSPVSTGESHLRIAPGADHPALLRQLDRLMVRLAARQRTPFVVFKEFAPREVVRTDALLDLGYLRADSPAMNYFPARYRDFDHFCASIRSRYRRQILHSRKKFQRSGLRVEHLRGNEGFEKLYTDEVHRLYLAVLSHADVTFECLPSQFFRELALQYGEHAAFTVIFQGERIVAFVCGIFDQHNYLNFFCGFDYHLNEEADLYFNLMYEDLDYALRQNARSLHVGQTANEFKSRMGCYLEPRFFYVKSRDPVLQFLVRTGSLYLFPPAPPITERNLFREVPDG